MEDGGSGIFFLFFSRIFSAKKKEKERSVDMIDVGGEPGPISTSARAVRHSRRRRSETNLGDPTTASTATRGESTNWPSTLSTTPTPASPPSYSIAFL